MKLKVLEFRLETWLYILIIFLAIFNLGVQFGIIQGKQLLKQELESNYGIIIPN